jgi:hypothetical protein
LVNISVVAIVCAGVKLLRTFIAVVGGNAIVAKLKFGYGIGINGSGGAGVLLTLGNPKLKAGIV